MSIRRGPLGCRVRVPGSARSRADAAKAFVAGDQFPAAQRGSGTRLIEKIDGLGFIERRNGDNSPERAQAGDGIAQVGLAIPRWNRGKDTRFVFRASCFAEDVRIDDMDTVVVRIGIPRYGSE